MAKCSKCGKAGVVSLIRKKDFTIMPREDLCLSCLIASVFHWAKGIRNILRRSEE